MVRTFHDPRFGMFEPAPTPDLSTAWVDNVEDPRDRKRPAVQTTARNIAVYYIAGHNRSRVICDAMARGIECAGDTPWLIDQAGFTHDHVDRFPIAVFYGLEGNLPLIFKSFRENNTAIYVDLGYWGRRDPGRWSGYHKVVVNARHPVAYYRRSSLHNFSRIHSFGVYPAPRVECNGDVLVAGMGDKGAKFEGFEVEVWERWAIGQIRQHTDRRIIYRPKPSWKKARPIEGVAYSDPAKPLDLTHISTVVTHHSNVAVDAIVKGIPCICIGGVASDMSSDKFETIDDAANLPDRDQRWCWMNDIAHTQWNVDEMARGLPWRHLIHEGFI